MKYEDIIKTEDTDGLYDMWQGYRTALTKYIISSAEHADIRRILSRTGALRLSGAYDKETAEKPVLAIWGAGGCNDIDIVCLAKHFKLVLIDRDTDKLISARTRFHLEESECLCVNLHFWDVDSGDYKLFEALLEEGTETEALREYLRALGGQPPDYSILPSFDYSVAVGLASQMNVRFAVLARLYGRYDELRDVLDELNRTAVHRLLDALRQMTTGAVIVGYELMNLEGHEDAEAENILARLNEEAEYRTAGNGQGVFGACFDVRPSVAGNEFLVSGIDAWITDGTFRVLCHRAMLWDFHEQKRYIMFNVTLYPAI